MLSAVKFDAMLNLMGQDASWRRAYDCPCRDPHSGAADPHCPVCLGKGVTWGAATTGRVAVSGQKVQQAWAKLGMYEGGDMVLTLPDDSPVYVMGQFDRLAMMQSTIPFSRTLIHDGTETLPFHVERIERVFWIVQGAIVEGAFPTVASDGSMTWPAPVNPGDPGAPPSGQQYSITGRQRPEYFCFKDFPQDRAHYGGQPLPRRVVMRLLDLYGR